MNCVHSASDHPHVYDGSSAPLYVGAHFVDIGSDRRKLGRAKATLDGVAVSEKMCLKLKNTFVKHVYLKTTGGFQHYFRAF